MPSRARCNLVVHWQAYDIAIMVVDTSYSNWMGVGWNENMMNTTFNTAGYPGEHVSSLCNHQQNGLFFTGVLACLASYL